MHNTTIDLTTIKGSSVTWDYGNKIITINGQDYAGAELGRIHGYDGQGVRFRAGKSQMGIAALDEAEFARAKAAYGDHVIAAATAADDRKEQAAPGYHLIKDAYRQQDSYHEAFQAAMEDEMNDGARMPAQPTADPETLAEKYPMGALLAKAESYQHASHYAKSGAGTKAAEMILSGATYEDAKAVLDNWSDGLAWD